MYKTKLFESVLVTDDKLLAEFADSGDGEAVFIDCFPGLGAAIAEATEELESIRLQVDHILHKNGKVQVSAGEAYGHHASSWVLVRENPVTMYKDKEDHVLKRVVATAYWADADGVEHPVVLLDVTPEVSDGLSISSKRNVVRVPVEPGSKEDMFETDGQSLVIKHTHPSRSMGKASKDPTLFEASRKLADDYVTLVPSEPGYNIPRFDIPMFLGHRCCTDNYELALYMRRMVDSGEPDKLLNRNFDSKFPGVRLTVVSALKEVNIATNPGEEQSKMTLEFIVGRARATFKKFVGSWWQWNSDGTTTVQESLDSSPI